MEKIVLRGHFHFILKGMQKKKVLFIEFYF
jgi:hypothetical protein